MKTALEILEDAVRTYKERRETYGDSYHRHAKIMTVLFPDGIDLNTASDFNRFSIFNMIIAKVCRYTNNFHNGHQDSIHDIGVYAFVLEELDQLIPKPPPTMCCEHSWGANGTCMNVDCFARKDQQ